MKEQKYAPDFSFIDSSFDDIKDFKMEPTGSYTLIRVNDGMIECALVNKDHEIVKAFRGKRAQELYHTIFEWEKKNMEFLTEKQHIAYLGKELNKAEQALKNNEEYVQE